MKRIVIDAPGAGEWIMKEAEGYFTPECDHSIANFDGDELLGGFALTAYLGNSIMVHQAGKRPDWCSRALMWMTFGYAFKQLKVHKLFAPVSSDNYHALELCLRAGWGLDTVIKDVYAPGRHMMLLSMEDSTCPWLRLKPPPESSVTTTVGEAA